MGMENSLVLFSSDDFDELRRKVQEKRCRACEARYVVQMWEVRQRERGEFALYLATTCADDCPNPPQFFVYTQRVSIEPFTVEPEEPS